MINIIFLIITIAISVLCFSLELLFVWDEIGAISTPAFSILFIINIIPILVFLFIKFIAQKDNCTRIINVCVNLFILTAVLFYFIFVGFCMLVGIIMFDSTPRIPKQEDYTKSLYKIQSEYQNNGFSHFPEILPKNITDYYFFIENSFDGEDTHYLKFKTDSSYVNKELQEKCNNKTVPKESVSNRFYTNKFPDAEEFCILHKSKQEELYSTGIATNKDHNVIYYFYANY